MTVPAKKVRPLDDDKRMTLQQDLMQLLKRADEILEQLFWDDPNWTSPTSHLWHDIRRMQNYAAEHLKEGETE